MTGSPPRPTAAPPRRISAADDEVVSAPGVLLLQTACAMLAFAANSLLCRVALRETEIDPASFTFIRIASGAAALCGIVQLRRARAADRTARAHLAGSWASATALFVYAAAFSFAYVSLSTGTGALLLFGAVQATMILWGVSRGERLSGQQLFGLGLAGAGLVALVFPGITAPSLSGSLLMLGAGIAWGVYSLRGKGAGDPADATAGNFVRGVPLAAALALASIGNADVDRAGVACAVASGALASGLGYVVWYAVLPRLRAASAATVQLSVPVLAAAGGILFLHEPITLRFIVAAMAVLGGITLVVRCRHKTGRSAPAAS